MTRRDAIYLLAVVVCATAFAFQVVVLATPPSEAGATGARTSVGRPRDVDMEALRELIRQGYLSDRDALFARPVAEDED